MPSKFIITKSAVSDLQAIKAADNTAHAELLVFLRELQDCRELVTRLLAETPKWPAPTAEDVIQWKSLYRRDYDLWRIKLIRPNAAHRYRVIYKYDIQSYNFYVLAIVVGEGFPYDDHSSPIVRRIIDDYNSY